MPGARNRTKVFHINLLKKWFEPEETAFMVGNLEIGEDDDIPSWRENAGSKVTVSEKLTTELRKQLEVLLKSSRMYFRRNLERIKPSNISYTPLRIIW